MLFVFILKYSKRNINFKRNVKTWTLSFLWGAGWVHVCLPKLSFFKYFEWTFPSQRYVWNTFRLFYANISRFAAILGRECKSMKYLPSLDTNISLKPIQIQISIQTLKNELQIQKKRGKENSIFGIYTIQFHTSWLKGEDKNCRQIQDKQVCREKSAKTH